MKLEDMPVVTVEQVLGFKEEAIRQRDELVADRDCWAQQANDRVKDWNDMRQERDALSAVVERQREALDQISDLCRHLRQGGPDPMDLESLNDGLVEAVTIADSMLSDDTPPSVDLALHDAEVLREVYERYKRAGTWACLGDWLRERLRAGGEG